MLLWSLLQIYMPQLSPLCYLFGGVRALSLGMLGKGPVPLVWLHCHVHPCTSFIIFSRVSVNVNFYLPSYLLCFILCSDVLIEYLFRTIEKNVLKYFSSQNSGHHLFNFTSLIPDTLCVCL